MKRERWGSLLVQEKYRGEKACDRRHPYRVIIIIIIIEAAYKEEIINIVEYPNTIYKDDQFVNNVKSHENTQPNMNSIIKTAAKSTK